MAYEYLGRSVAQLEQDLSQWSQATFGTDKQRGPEGALKHLEEEVQEALAQPGDVFEYADCLMLIIDAARRAGFDFTSLVEATHVKLASNKQRTWPIFTPGDNTPIHHRKLEPDIEQ